MLARLAGVIARSPARYVVWLVPMLVSVSGCSPPDPSELRAEARDAIDAGNFREADIHLRNLLRQEPQDTAARVLLGRVALELDDPVGAEGQLSRALELGAEPALVKLPLVQALVEQGKHESALEQAVQGPPVPGNERSDLLRLTGVAHSALGELEAAESDFREALAEQPESLEIRTELAGLLIAMERVEDARTMITGVLGQEPGYAPALLLLGQLDRAGGDTDSAEQAFRAVAEIARSGSGVRTAAIAQLAELRLARGDKEGAARWAETLATDVPGEPISEYVTAQLELARGEVESAARRLEAVLAEHPDYLPATVLLGVVSADSGNFGQSEMYLRTAIARAPGDERARLMLARTYLLQGRLDHAREVLGGAYADAVGDAVLFALAGRLSLERGEIAAAEEYFEQSASIATQTPEQLFGLARIYAAAGEAERAVQLLESLDFSTPEEAAVASYVLVISYLSSNDLASAMTEARRLVATLPQESWTHALAANVASRLDDSATARRELGLALEIDPDQAAMVIALAGLELADGDAPRAADRVGQLYEHSPTATTAILAYRAASAAGREKSESFLEDWLTREPLDPAVNFAYGSYLLRSGDPDAAISRFENVVAADPNHAEASNNLAWLLSERGDPRALEFARKAYSAAPGNGAVADTFAWLLMQAGDASAAAPLLDQAVALLPANAEIRYHRGVVMAELGEIETAIADLEAALADNQPSSWREDAENTLEALRIRRRPTQ